jgi:hypothetical protein
MSDLLLHTKIVEILNENPAFTVLVGKRLFPSEASNNSSEEVYVVYDQIAGEDDKTHQGDTETPVSVFEFKIYSPSARGRLEVSDALNSALVTSELTERAGFALSSVDREYVYDSKESVTREKAGRRVLYRRLVNYRVRWQDKSAIS